MNCSSCGQEVAETANFCRHCGAAQVSSQSAAGIDPDSSPETSENLDPTEQLRDVIASLQTQVGHLTARVSALESASLARPSVISNAAIEASYAARVPSATSPNTASTASPSTPSSTPGAQPATVAGVVGTPPSSVASGLSSWNWEWLVGGNWLARIGILALIIGVGFFLKLAFDNQWIGETGRVVLGLALGLALLGGGEYWTRKYPAWAQAVTGGGLAILYVSIFAAFALYDLIPALVALGFSFLVTLTAAGLAIRYESRVIAVLGILGGFATPVFLSEELPQQWALQGYVLVLDVGVLALATFRNWRWFTLLALLGSLILFTYWVESDLEPSVAVSQLAITVIFLIFVAATTLFHLIWKRPPQAFDQALMVVNAAAYLFISYNRLFDEYRDWMGGFTVILAAFYGLLGYGILVRYRDQVNLSMFAVGIALVLLSIAVPVQLSGPWIGMAWAVEGAVLVWLSFFVRMYQLRWFGLASFAVAVGWLLISDLPNDFGVYVPYYENYSEAYWPFFNLRILSNAITIAAAYATAFIWWRGRDDYEYEGEAYAPLAFVVLANMLTLWILSIQVAELVELAGDRGTIGLPYVGNVISLGLSALWAIYAAAMIVLGIVRRERWLRLGGLGLLAIPVLKLFIYDAFEMDQGYRVASFIGLGALLVIGGFLYQRFSRAIRGFLLE